jgi:hypothetical protein
MANKDLLKVKYEVHYEETGEDELYSMNLLRDLQKEKNVTKNILDGLKDGQR